jgi:uncharacterized protein
MQFNLDSDIHSHTIRTCQPGEITITLPAPSSTAAGPLETETLNGSFVISPKQLIHNWPPLAIDNLLPEHLDTLVELQPELVLLGTGPRLQFPNNDLLMTLYSHQIGVEIMDTAAACRTYNILMAEGRHVVAGLINPGNL